jgi:hypothetical protein
VGIFVDVQRHRNVELRGTIRLATYKVIAEWELR